MVFGTLVGVFAFSVMWSELLMTEIVLRYFLNKKKQITKNNNVNIHDYYN